jgi:hypothetical protein
MSGLKRKKGTTRKKVDRQLFGLSADLESLIAAILQYSSDLKKDIPHLDISSSKTGVFKRYKHLDTSIPCE